ncbi:MAG: hypothetical protein ACRCV6_03095 [Formosimonas sp.]
MWDAFVSWVGIIGTALLLVLYVYLKWKKHQAVKAAAKNKG